MMAIRQRTKIIYFVKGNKNKRSQKNKTTTKQNKSSQQLYARFGSNTVISSTFFLSSFVFVAAKDIHTKRKRKRKRKKKKERRISFDLHKKGEMNQT
jgi:hypothetical protein